MNPDDRPQLKHQIGRYRIVASLGQGGMGTIWLAVAGGLGEFRKLLVIKELRQDLTRNHRFVEMFLDEAKLAARLNHPNVVHTLEAGQDGDRYFLSMEFLDGQPLTEVMQRATNDPRISLPIRLRILCDVLSGLHHAHELREYDGTNLHIVHRDISPQNVFVTYDGQIKVVDFGIAKAADAGNVTQPGVFKGKFSYAAPEQIKGQLVDRRADVFSVGVLLWELVSLQRFAKGKPTQASVDARLKGSEPRLAEAEPETDELLCEICDRALAVEPADRFATAEEFRAALEQYLLISGERVDATTIASVMQATFYTERAAMHRMIDARLKDSDFSESMVRALRPIPSDELSEEDPTKVGDLSELVQSSRNARLDELVSAGSNTGADAFGRALRGDPRAKWGAALALGLLLALIVFAIVREPRAPGAVPGASAPAAEAGELDPGSSAPADPASPTGAVAPAPTASAKPAAGTAVLAPAPLPLPVDAVAPRSTDRGESRPNTAPARSGSSRGGTARRGSASDQPAESGRTNDERAAERGESDAPADEASARDRERNPAAPGKADRSAPDLGGDLREVPKAERRRLDLEDPFQ
jgi:serine/threonine-protein kinase